jgi:hypothetical protein
MSQHDTDPAGATAYGTRQDYRAEPAFDEGDGSTTDQVKEQVRDKAQVAQDKAQGALGQARGRISDQVDQRSTQAGERISQQAADVRSVAEQLRSQGKDGPASVAEQVASQADRVGDYLKGASGDRILHDVEDFARRQPLLVAAGALALGFAASRFLKASSSRRYETGSGGYDGRGYDRAYASPYDTRTLETASARTYASEVPYAPSTTPATGTPVAGTFDPEPALTEPMSDPLSERRS